MGGIIMKKTSIILILLALMISGDLFAQRTTDIENGSDYPLVSRFKGSVMEWYAVENFDRYYMLSLKDNALDKYEIDGKITRIQYSSQAEHSVYEIYKSYEEALKTAGFEILLKLDKTNCALNLSESLYVGEFDGLNALPAGQSIKPDFNEGEFAYLSAKKKIDDMDVYVVVYVTKRSFPLITFDAVEVKSMDKGLVSVNDLEKGIAAKGHIAVYDIHFESGKSDIMPESAEALKNVADYLNNHTNTKYMVVGHTDNVGDFNSNLELSKSRADAVVNELVTKYRVKTEQLKAYGDGSTAPVASNSTDEGKAKNRRVEIVEQ